MTEQEKSIFINILVENKDSLHLYKNDLQDKEMRSLFEDYSLLVEADDKRIMKNSDDKRKEQQYKRKL